MGQYPCLFRFEDNFEPTTKVDWDHVDDAVLQHLAGTKPAFYSYGRHLVPCLTKYYHYPTANEELTMVICENAPTDGTVYAGRFNSIEEARSYYNNPLFPKEYPSIEDGEVLAEHKLTPSISLRFGYDVYFLVLLSIYGPEDWERNIVRAREVITTSNDLLAQYKVSCTDETERIARILLSHWKLYDDYRPSLHDVMSMPVWATTFPEESSRNMALMALTGRM